jgi:hypothetical protein
MPDLFGCTFFAHSDDHQHRGYQCQYQKYGTFHNAHHVRVLIFKRIDTYTFLLSPQESLLQNDGKRRNHNDRVVVKHPFAAWVKWVDENEVAVEEYQCVYYL